MSTDACVTVYDALEQARKLKDVGFADEQAEALARGMRDAAYSSRDDLAAKTDISALEVRLYRALWIQGAGIIAILTGFFAAFRFIP